MNALKDVQHPYRVRVVAVPQILQMEETVTTSESPPRAASRLRAPEVDEALLFVRDVDRWCASICGSVDPGRPDGCPLCPTFQPASLQKLKSHLTLTHLKHGVKVKDVLAVPCYRECRPNSRVHYHCVCQKILNKRETMLHHAKLCNGLEAESDLEARRKLEQMRKIHIEAQGALAEEMDEDLLLVRDVDRWCASIHVCGMVGPKCEGGCPLCPNFKPARLKKIKCHLTLTHLKHAVKVKDVLAVPCYRGCRPSSRGHYHCLCKKVLRLKGAMLQHAKLCNGQELESEAKGKQRLKQTRKKEPPAEQTVRTDPKPPEMKPKNVAALAINDNVSCDICGVSLLRRNLRRHIKDKHGHSKRGLGVHQFRAELPRAVVVDPASGLHMVSKSSQGNEQPIHVLVRVSDSTQRIQCELKECGDATRASQLGKLSHFACKHVKAAMFADPMPLQRTPTDKDIDDLIHQNLLDINSKAELCKKLQTSAAEHTTFAVSWTPSRPELSQYLYVSVPEPKLGKHSALGRIVVRYSSFTGKFNCPCSAGKCCLHRQMALLHLAVNTKDLMVYNTLCDEEGSLEAAEAEPTGFRHQQESSPVDMQTNALLVSQYLEYLRKEKNLPPNFKGPAPTGINTLRPSEARCHVCSFHPNLRPAERVPSEAKIYDILGTHPVTMYVKECPVCGMVYRYQEHIDGLHNFDNSIILTARLCMFFRSGLQNHTAVGRLLDIVSGATGEQYPKKVLDAYLHFESLCDHGYRFHCVMCGRHPPARNQKAAALSRSASRRSDPDCPKSSEEVNMEAYWQEVEGALLVVGFTKKDAKPPTAAPSCNFWPPWIPPGTVCDQETVVNAEARKIRGGFVSGACSHGVTYTMKSVLRPERVRDGSSVGNKTLTNQSSSEDATERRIEDDPPDHDYILPTVPVSRDQVYSSFQQDVSFLDSTCSISLTKYMFLLRLLMHLRNEKQNAALLQRLEHHKPAGTVIVEDQEGRMHYAQELDVSEQVGCADDASMELMTATEMLQEMTGDNELEANMQWVWEDSKGAAHVMTGAAHLMCR